MKKLASYLKKFENDYEKFSRLFKKKSLEMIMKNLASYLKKSLKLTLKNLAGYLKKAWK